jgi:dTDP-4-dehydrorhamnose 3,5-epimerase-like enzyme
MNIETLPILDLKLLHLFQSADERGDFVKTFHAKDFEKYQLDMEIKDE